MPTTYAHGLNNDDIGTLRRWIATFGDDATEASTRRHVRLLLALRAMHPRTPSLDELLDDPMARSVLCARAEGRPWALRRYRRWCEQARRGHG